MEDSTRVGRRVAMLAGRRPAVRSRQAAEVLHALSRERAAACTAVQLRDDVGGRVGTQIGGRASELVGGQARY